MNTVDRLTCTLIGRRFWLVGILLLSVMFSPRALAQFTTTTHNGQITIVKYTGPGGVVAIPATINGLPVISLGDKYVPNNAFRDCDSVTGITIPSSVTSIGFDGFSDCKNLVSITVAKQNPVYSSLGGVLFNRSQTELIAYPRVRAGGYTIPDSVSIIGIAAFYKCKKLTNVTMPHHVRSIAPYAFSGCINLTDVDIPKRVTIIGLYAFYDCRKLTSVTIPKSVAHIGQGAFQSCTRLKRADFGGNTPSMDPDVFTDVASGFVVSYAKGATGFTSLTCTDSSGDTYSTSRR